MAAENLEDTMRGASKEMRKVFWMIIGMDSHVVNSF